MPPQRITSARFGCQGRRSMPVRRGCGGFGDASGVTTAHELRDLGPWRWPRRRSKGARWPWRDCSTIAALLARRDFFAQSRNTVGIGAMRALDLEAARGAYAPRISLAPPAPSRGAAIFLGCATVIF